MGSRIQDLEFAHRHHGGAVSVKIWVESGEGEGPWHRDEYTGKLSARALNARLAKERVNGDRKATLILETSSWGPGPASIDDVLRAAANDKRTIVTNDRRGRPMVTITLSRDGLAELDRQRGNQPRGPYVEALILERKKRSK